MKTCTKCGEKKPLTDFPKAKRYKDGLSCLCRACHAAATSVWRKANQEKVLAYRKEWQAANPEKIKEQRARRYKKNTEKVKIATAKWVAANPERVKSYKLKWREKNPEKVKAIKAGWSEKNREKERARCAAWRNANRGKARAASSSWRTANIERARANSSSWYELNPLRRRIYEQNRRARKRANGGVLSKNISEKLFFLQRGKCACCGLPLGNDYHLDHIMPVALGGVNEDWNVQLLRGLCNNQKSAKHPVEFMQARGFLL